jgi:CBS domain-containing protein
MNLASLCRRDIISVSAQASVHKAAELMRVHHVGALALTDPEDPAQVVGVVTDRDLVVNLLAQGLSLIHISEPTRR